ncbi:hypothetical protein B5P46_01555 [Rhizobium leguminosarum]|uniref:Uncharacterized protein n=1 Tax=Rhizobium leguminosarum TaxID=384 RepID=A0A4Q1UF84_RHILE|nr:hypothetical protein B5P46_01555 [Rhizobium leguminosarum]
MTGVSHSLRAKIEALGPVALTVCVLALPTLRIRSVKPSARAWTTDGKLRHPSHKGLRERQDNADVFRLD